MHPWHDIDLGERVEDWFRVVVEIPKGSKVKYELTIPSTSSCWSRRRWCRCACCGRKRSG